MSTAPAVIDLPTSLGPNSRGGPEFKRVLEAIGRSEVDAHYVHLAEGKRDNERSQKEFHHLAEASGG